MAIRLLIVDDHRVVREGLRMFLGRDQEVEIVGEAMNGTEAIVKARHLQPDIILMDLLLPGIDGVAATTAIHQELPQIRVIALTSMLEGDMVVKVLRAGAAGYLLKDAQPTELRTAIKAVSAGQVYLSPQVTCALQQKDARSELLTGREEAVLRLLTRGYDNRAIGRTLHMSEENVKEHVRDILTKLGVESRFQAAQAAIRLGLVAQDMSSL